MKHIIKLQDFNYVHSNAMEITLELSCCKHPPASTLTRHWLDNKNALMAYMEKTNSGVKGVVMDINGLYIFRLCFIYLVLAIQATLSPEPE